MTSGNAMATGLAFAVFAVGTHGHAEFLEEKALEVFVAAEAATFRDVFDRQFRACEQSRHAFQLMPSDAIVDRFALKLAEPEVGQTARDTHLLHDIFHLDAAGRVLPDERECAFHDERCRHDGCGRFPFNDPERRQ